MANPSIIVLGNDIHGYEYPDTTYCGISFTPEELRHSIDNPNFQAMPCNICERAAERSAITQVAAVNPVTDLKKFAVTHAVELVKSTGKEFEECFKLIWEKLT